jgi:hypothetical protein
MKEMIKRCSECGSPILQGYCIDNGFEYYCDDKCLHKNISPETWEKLYNDGHGDSYWTEWESDEDETEAIILLQEAREELEDALSFMELIEDPDTNERLIRKSELLDKLAKFIKRME